MPRKAGGSMNGRRRRKRGRPPGKKGLGVGMGLVGGSEVGGRLVAEMRAYHDELTNRCAQLQAEMTAISSAMDAMASVGKVSFSSATPARRGRPRGRVGGGSLKDFIGNVLGSSGSPMKLINITSGVTRAGYQSKSRNLSNQVSMALAEMTKNRRIRKVSRGMYAA